MPNLRESRLLRHRPTFPQTSQQSRRCGSSGRCRRKAPFSSTSTTGRIVSWSAAASCSWEIADGRYRLATNGRTIGLAALFYPFGVSSASEGRITEAGFEPDSFRLDRTGKKGEKQYRVEFDRASGVARFTDPDGVREVPLRPSSLDILSLVCQLSVVRLEPGPLRLNLTNGRKLDTYEVEVGPQEIVETPMGELRAVYVKQVRKPGDEGIEVWLAVDFAYLPVRLRFTDRKGSIAAEQLVTGVQLVRG